MRITEEQKSQVFTSYHIVIPISLVGILIASVIASSTLILVICNKRLHTTTHLLICNTSISSILFCIVQCVNYAFLIFIQWEINDSSCRWRGFFGYLTIAAVIYSYLVQAISRFCNSILWLRYPKLTSFKSHLILILIQWIIVFLLPLPALLTQDIYYRPFSLCWVPRKRTLHVVYTVLAYYLIPTLLIFAIYIYIYVRMQYPRRRALSNATRRRSNRDFEVLCNIITLFAIYLIGAIPTILFILTNISSIYGLSLVSLSFTVAIEKFVTLLLDRDLKHIIRLYFYRSTIQIRPIA